MTPSYKSAGKYRLSRGGKKPVSRLSPRGKFGTSPDKALEGVAHHAIIPTAMCLMISTGGSNG